MKSVFCETNNVRKAMMMLSKMTSKKGADMTLIYGYPGTGKSHLALKNFAQNGWGYYRIETMDTPKSFLREIYRSLHFELTGNESVLRGDGATLAKATIEMFQDISYQRENQSDKKPYIFFIDEVNLAIQHRKWQILELIRDFRDIAGAKIVMIGEEDTKKRLERYNSHFFNRCSNFCEFEIPNNSDMSAIISKSMEIEYDKDVLAMMLKRASGSLHHLEVIIKEFESIARIKGIHRLSIKDIVRAANDI